MTPLSRSDLDVLKRVATTIGDAGDRPIADVLTEAATGANAAQLFEGASLDSIRAYLKSTGADEVALVLSSPAQVLTNAATERHVDDRTLQTNTAELVESAATAETGAPDDAPRTVDDPRYTGEDEVHFKDQVERLRADFDEPDYVHIGGKQASDEMSELMQLQDGETLADLGCGDLHTGLEYMAALPNSKLIGVDLSSDACAKAREKTAAAGMNGRVEVQHASVSDMEIEPNSIDKAYSIDGDWVTYVKDRKETFGKILDGLKPGGEFALQHYFPPPGVSDEIKQKSAEINIFGGNLPRGADADAVIQDLKDAGFQIKVVGNADELYRDHHAKVMANMLVKHGSTHSVEEMRTWSPNELAAEAKKQGLESYDSWIGQWMSLWQDCKDEVGQGMGIRIVAVKPEES